MPDRVSNIKKKKERKKEKKKRRGIMSKT